MKILHLDSSALGANSVSRSLTAEVVAELRRVDASAQVRYRDLAAMTLPAVTEELLHGMRRFPGQAEPPALAPTLRSTRGGRMSGAPHEVALDHQEAYLRAVFGFIGIQNLKFVRAEGLAMSQFRDESIADANVHAAQLAKELA